MRRSLKTHFRVIHIPPAADSIFSSHVFLFSFFLSDTWEIVRADNASVSILETKGEREKKCARERKKKSLFRAKTRPSAERWFYFLLLCSCDLFPLWTIPAFNSLLSFLRSLSSPNLHNHSKKKEKEKGRWCISDKEDVSVKRRSEAKKYSHPLFSCPSWSTSWAGNAGTGCGDAGPQGSFCCPGIGTSGCASLTAWRSFCSLKFRRLFYCAEWAGIAIKMDRFVRGRSYENVWS